MFNEEVLEGERDLVDQLKSYLDDIDRVVAEALEQLRQQAPDRETLYYVYVIDDGRRLRGFISLRDLILARPAELRLPATVHES